MKIAFRTDASIRIGTGHVMRCLTLADALLERGAECTFICRLHDGHLIHLIEARGHKSIGLEPISVDAVVSNPSSCDSLLSIDWKKDVDQTIHVLGESVYDWIIVDHYALDDKWETAIRKNTKHIFVIDDLANRKHNCDMLLDQNLGREKSDYDMLLEKKTDMVFIGPEYALIRGEFAQYREYSLRRRINPSLRNILITMGGVDENNFTSEILNVLLKCDLPAGMVIDVVLGSNSPWLSSVNEYAELIPCQTRVHVGVTNMAQMMSQSDLCIGAAGVTAWERCVLGLPSIILVVADNQSSGAKALNDHGAAILINSVEHLQREVIYLLNSVDSNDKLKKLCNASKALCFGDGVHRIAQELIAINE